MEIRKNKGSISNSFLERGITNLNDALSSVQNLPYGRNSNRSNYKLVLEEFKGACSTKHALLKALDIEQHWNLIDLKLGIFMMGESTNPELKDVFQNSILQQIPEAHCYLSINHKRIDITFPNSSSSMELEILHEKSILPDQIGNDKITFHQSFIHQWIDKSQIDLLFSEVWSLREECIKALSN